jgi:ATP-dependent DNA helicase RecG
LKSELNIHTFGDLLQHFPFRYIDRSQFNKTNERFKDGDTVQFIGKIISFELIQGKKIVKNGSPLCSRTVLAFAN